MSTVNLEVQKIGKETKHPKSEKKCCYCGNIHVFKKLLCSLWGKRCTNCKGRNEKDTDEVCNKRKEVKEMTLTTETEDPSHPSDLDSEAKIPPTRRIST